jgi:hypothetical protein
MRTILIPLAGLAALSATACTTVTPPPSPVAAATPVSATRAEYCREYTSMATVGDSEQETVGTACLGPDGTWRIADPDNPPSPAPASLPQTYAAAPPVAADPAPAYSYYPGYAYYPAPYYYAPYPYYYGPTVGVGVGFRFGGGHHHHW